MEFSGGNFREALPSLSLVIVRNSNKYTNDMNKADLIGFLNRHISIANFS